MAAFSALHGRGGRIMDILLAVLFPARCLDCEAALPPLDRRVVKSGKTFTDLTAGLICAECAGAFRPVESPLCSRCGILFIGRHGEDHLCGDCLEKRHRFSIARAGGVYDGPLLALIQALKYQGKTRVAEPLGTWLYRIFLQYWGDGGVDGIVPVPLYSRRLRRRGFNQAALLVRHWPALAGTGVSWRIAADTLVRTRRTASQAGLDRRAREKNIRGAFALANGPGIRGQRLLLIDDVMTTGATADACARVLLGAGAERVDMLTLARAI
jgi:ComF family protein